MLDLGVSNSEVWQNHEAAPEEEEAKPYPSTQKEAEFQAPAELTRQEAGPGRPQERQGGGGAQAGAGGGGHRAGRAAGASRRSTTRVTRGADREWASSANEWKPDGAGEARAGGMRLPSQSAVGVVPLSPHSVDSMNKESLNLAGPLL